MKNKVLKVHPDDNVIVALTHLQQGEKVQLNGNEFLIRENIEAKHKFFEQDTKAGSEIIMYGVIVGTTQVDVSSGQWMNTSNVKHATSPYAWRNAKLEWKAPDVSAFAQRTFNGYHRKDGRVGTANYWLFIPTVFCEKRNMDVIDRKSTRLNSSHT